MAAISAMAVVCRSPDPISRHRTQYKCTTPPWKETYRKRCKERLKNGRQKYLATFRQMESTAAPVVSVVERVMDEEWRRLSGEHSELPPWKPTKESCKPFADVNLGLSEESELNEILNIMEEIQQELMDEEQSILAQYDENLRFEEESLCAAIQSLTTDDVICPVCERNPLCQNKQVIFCRCGIRIDTEHDAIDLSYVRGEIEASVRTHSDEGCHAKPDFIVSQVGESGISNLLMQCQYCGFMYIIL